MRERNSNSFRFKTAEFLQSLGLTIDSVIGRTPCDAMPVKLDPKSGRGKGDIMVLAGEGSHAPVAARYAAEFVSRSNEKSIFSLFNMQKSHEDGGDDLVPEERGEVVIVRDTHPVFSSF